MDLFRFAADQNQSPYQPLAELLRPQRLDEMLGQPKILGRASPWHSLIEAGHLPSLILWGPPGTGKTTFALLLARQSEIEFISVNAVEIGAKQLREIGDLGRRRRIEEQKKTIVFVDEIHRLNKSQQDVLLPFVEKGDVILVGATTENPSYEINAALLSRCRLLVFEPLSTTDIKELLIRAAKFKKLAIDEIVDSSAQEALVEVASGDARRLLNIFEVIVNCRNVELQKVEHPVRAWPMDKNALVELLSSQNILRYDKTADEHFDTISAFIKSVRGSDPDAAVYYLARMLKGGEDPIFIARRLVILASEDVGNADPRALSVAVSGLHAVEMIGLPEAAITLAQVATYLASAPKSNRSYEALQKAKDLVEKTGALPIPLALRSAKTKLLKSLGYGVGYRYSHEAKKGYIPQRFMPDELGEIRLYEPSDHGFEKTIRQYLNWMKS